MKPSVVNRVTQPGGIGKPISKVGTLYGWFETGTEGVIWTLQEDGKPDYDGMHILRDGDHLTVWEPSTGRMVFRQTIKFDTKIGYHPFPLNPACGQQAALGFWVHGIQEGFAPDDWARLFFRSKDDVELRAEVTSRPKRDRVEKVRSPKASSTKFRRKR